MRAFILYTLLLMSSTGTTQDSLEVLSYEEYIKIVTENHPVIVRANLLRETANGVDQMARGGFDPKIGGEWDQKAFDEKNYYTLASGGLKIPTWYGIEVKTGYNNNSGEFLNDGDFLPSAGLWNAGISIPLGKGLIIDDRRAELQKAKIFAQATEQERIIALNELVYNASIAYLEWQTSYANVAIAIEGVEIAETRFEGTKSSFINGDKAAIDTLESLISIQSRMNDRLKAEQELMNLRMLLDNYLWLDGILPLEIQDNVRPEVIDLAMWENEVNTIALNTTEMLASHPELLLYDMKQRNLEVEKRLLREDLKPDLRLAYNPLLASGNNGSPQTFNIGDYKFGATFQYPILQRKSRGKIKITDVKIQNTLLDQRLKAQKIGVQLDLLLNNQGQLVDQYDLMTETIDNYRSLLQAENIKFNIGESSVFLLNSRESKLLDSQYKRVTLQKKLLKNKYSYLFYSGGIYELITGDEGVN